MWKINLINETNTFASKVNFHQQNYSASSSAALSVFPLSFPFLFHSVLVVFDTLFILIQHLRLPESSRDGGACPILHAIVHTDPHSHTHTQTNTNTPARAVNADRRGSHPARARVALRRRITAFLFLTHREIDGHLRPSTRPFPRTNWFPCPVYLMLTKFILQDWNMYAEHLIYHKDYLYGSNHVN